MDEFGGMEINNVETFANINDVDDVSNNDGDVLNELNNNRISENNEINASDYNTDSEDESFSPSSDLVSNNNSNSSNSSNSNSLSLEEIDVRLNSLNSNVNSLLEKINNNDIFQEESQDNIHDLILFVLFGIFIIFVIDSIYKLGKLN